jgi:Carboxypeptidase regulatory-like domain/TonB dependent receptor/TonB-dependent Receptor Plug Domain
MKTMSCFRRAAAATLWSAIFVMAQGITGDLSVTVSDPNGASVTNATLTLKNVQENTTITGYTNAAGNYIFGELKPGSYSLEIKAQGFQPQHLNDITIQLAQRAAVGVKLTLGTVTETVNVSAAAATLLNAESATEGQVLQQQTIASLPLNGRNFIQLAQLSSGVTPIGTGNSPATTWTGRTDQTISIEGLRESNTSYLVNGIETRNARFGNAGIRPDPDAIQEFNVQRGFFTPDYGGSAGIVNTALRSGTNDLHLVAFELVRNKDFDANDYFANAAGQSSPPPFTQNQFGATAAGPIIIPKLYNGRNKLFFMFNYEGFRQREGLNLTGLYPSAAQLAGNLADNSAGTGLFPTNSSFCSANPGSQHCANVIDPTTGLPFRGNVIPPSRLNPVSQKAIPFTPVPNVAVNPNAASFPTFNTFASPKQINDFDQYNARIDYQASSKDAIYGSYSNSNEPLYVPAIQILGGTNNPLKDQLWTATWVRSFTPTIVNELRFGHNDTSTYKLEEGADGPNYAANTFGLKNTSTNPFDFGVPSFGITGFGSIGSFSEAIGADEENFQYVDNLSITRGNHNFKIGFQIMHLKYFEITDFGGVPNFSFSGQFTGLTNGLADFLLGTPYTATTSVGDSSQNMVSNYYGGYLSDNWHVLPRLTLNLGLRYEFQPWPREINGRAEFFDFSTGKEVIAGHGVRPEIVDPDYNNFAPRVGLAYQVNKNTVLRAGGGIYYSTDNANELQFEIVGAPFYSSQTISATTPTISLSNLFPAAGVGASFNPFTLNPRSRTPYVSQWTFDVQHTFANNNFVEVGYTGSTSQKLPQRYNPDSGTIDPTGTIPLPDRQPFPQFKGFILFSDNDGWASYQALTVRYEHRFNAGLYLLGAYTYQKALDLGNTDDFSMISADFKKFDRGPSDYDVPQRFVVSFNYDLPFGRGKRLLGGASGLVNALVGGWQVNGIATFSKGQYHTITTSQFWPNISPTFNTSVPNVVGDPTANQNPRGLWFNPAAFAYPTQHIEGDAGRNQFEVPGFANWDMSLFKTTRITERLAAQLRVEAFNIFNHTQFGVPNLTWGTPTFGTITSTLQDARRLQLGMRVTF